MSVVAFQPSGRRPLGAPDDAPLVSRAASGELSAFEALYRAHAGWVYGLCLRLTGDRQLAEDCTQECFVGAWRGLRGFRKQSQFSTWLHSIAVHTVLNRRRAERRSSFLSAEDHAEFVAAVPGATDAAGPIDLERAIAHLPPGARDVLILVGIYGYSHEEAATMLNIATGTSKAQLHRARSLLTTRLDIAITEQA